HVSGPRRPRGTAGRRGGVPAPRHLPDGRRRPRRRGQGGSRRPHRGQVGQAHRHVVDRGRDAEPRAEPAVVAEPVEGMTVIYSDADIVVVDKPVGVAAHASVGWTGPTVIGGLAAAGYRISTSGPPERKGIV